MSATATLPTVTTIAGPTAEIARAPKLSEGGLAPAVLIVAGAEEGLGATQGNVQEAPGEPGTERAG